MTHTDRLRTDMKDLRQILELHLEGLIYSSVDVDSIRTYQEYFALVRALAPEQADPDEDCIGYIAEQMAEQMMRRYGHTEQAYRIFLLLHIFATPLGQASLLGPQDTWGGTRNILFGCDVDYIDGLRRPESFPYVQQVHEQYQRRVGSLLNVRSGSFRVIQQKVMPVHDKVADTAYLMLIETPAWHLRQFLTFIEKQ